MSRTFLVVANLLLALLLVSLVALAVVFGILAWFAHPCVERECGLFALMCVGVLSAIAALGGVHAAAAWAAWKGAGRWLQAALAAVYLVACPVGVVVVAPSIWTGATGIALLYVGFFLCGIAYALLALAVLSWEWVSGSVSRRRTR